MSYAPAFGGRPRYMAYYRDEDDRPIIDFVRAQLSRPSNESF
jgi:hypothetical protein